jgi:hypothetical protein
LLKNIFLGIREVWKISQEKLDTAIKDYAIDIGQPSFHLFVDILEESGFKNFTA